MAQGFKMLLGLHRPNAVSDYRLMVVCAQIEHDMPFEIDERAKRRGVFNNVVFFFFGFHGA